MNGRFARSSRPFVDRGGLMGFEVPPWKEGDEERFEVFTITSDEKWVPRRYIDKSDIEKAVFTSVEGDETHDPVQEYHDAKQHEEESYPLPSDDLHLFHDVPQENGENDTIHAYDSGDTYPFGVFDPPDHPYLFDPSDYSKEVCGFTVKNLLSVPPLLEEPFSGGPVDEFLSYLTTRELLGYEEYDGFYDGYPAMDPIEGQYTMDPMNMVPNLFRQACTVRSDANYHENTNVFD